MASGRRLRTLLIVAAIMSFAALLGAGGASAYTAHAYCPTSGNPVYLNGYSNCSYGNAATIVENDAQAYACCYSTYNAGSGPRVCVNLQDGGGTLLYSYSCGDGYWAQSYPSVFSYAVIRNSNGFGNYLSGRFWH
jgi:hypothetical protein